jgi:hypothetical protein
MSSLKRIVLDVLKPHHPNALDFASAIADENSGCRVTVTVTEVDERTESTVVVIEGDDIPYQVIVGIITRLGGSVHSIDEVEVSSVPGRSRRRSE